MKIIFTGGGTGGHIYPALALIKKIKEKQPDTEILYIGKVNSQEEKICKEESIPFIGINVLPLYRKNPFKNIKTMFSFFKSYQKCKRIIKEFKPDWIIGTGGYVSCPVIYAGSKKRYKTIIHEQNAIPGLTNRFLAKYVSKVAISFPSSAKYFPGHKVVLTGNPRAQLVYETKRVNKRELGLSDSKKCLLIFMGSLGAKYVNETIVKLLPLLNKHKDWEIVFVTGNEHFDDIKHKISSMKLSNIHLKPYIDNMPNYYQHADLVICRAGATTLSEIAALGLAAILIPSPYVTNNHQEKNAQAFVESKSAVMIREKALNETILYETIRSLLENPYELRLLRNQIFKQGIRDSCDRFLMIIDG